MSVFVSHYLGENKKIDLCISFSDRWLFLKSWADNLLPMFLLCFFIAWSFCYTCYVVLFGIRIIANLRILILYQNYSISISAEPQCTYAMCTLATFSWIFHCFWPTFSFLMLPLICPTVHLNLCLLVLWEPLLTRYFLQYYTVTLSVPEGFHPGDIHLYSMSESNPRIEPGSTFLINVYNEPKLHSFYSIHPKRFWDCGYVGINGQSSKHIYMAC